MLPAYTHIVNNRLKHTYLSFDDEGTLIIKSPKISQQYLEALLLKKSSWIRRSKAKMDQKRGRAVHFGSGSKLYLYGEAYTLTLQKQEHKQIELTQNEKGFLLSYTHYNENVFQSKIDTFYKEEAQRYLPSRVALWAETMGRTYRQLSFRKTKRQWGSCSARNNLSFNTMMMKLPPSVIDYIIVHELAHIHHKHHQAAFWRDVAVYLPDYKQQITILKTYTT